MGVILWYRVFFPDLGIEVSNDTSGGRILSDAEITVTYGLGQPGEFTVQFAALPLSAHRTLAKALTGERGSPKGAVAVEITLGYLESPGSRKPVLKGLVDGMTVSRRYPPLGVRLTGYEKAAFLLRGTKKLDDAKGGSKLAHYAGTDISPADAARAIVAKAGLTLAEGATPTKSVERIAVDATNAFTVLEELARQSRAEILVQDGTVQFGTAVTYPPAGPGGLKVPDPTGLLAFLTKEDTLFVPGSTARLAEFEPVQAGTDGKHRVDDDLPDQTSVTAFDFTVLGLPELRAGQLAGANVDGYQAFRDFRIIQLTHSFSPREGYRCTGRAAAFKAGTGDQGNRKNTEAARQGSPAAIADAIAGRIRDVRTVTPAVDVGQVRSAVPEKRVADVAYGQGEAPETASPSVDLAIGDGGPVLHGEPLAAPFAWHKVGLSVPVYAGMRALLNEVRAVRSDSVVTGFLWANEPAMDRPKAKAGDWWLCLPTKLSAGPDPRPDGKGANDLTAADGRRVVEAVGLKLTVGTSACSDVGERPTEGTAEEFLLSHKSGTEVRIDTDGNVKITSSSGKVTVSAGGATLTVGDGKVAIT
ncbi:hypothetical protein ACPC54_39855 [Kitasatospora sp. NPDC094028]